jgi:hypothetical protein
MGNHALSELGLLLVTGEKAAYRILRIETHLSYLCHRNRAFSREFTRNGGFAYIVLDASSPIGFVLGTSGYYNDEVRELRTNSATASFPLGLQASLASVAPGRRVSEGNQTVEIAPPQCRLYSEVWSSRIGHRLCQLRARRRIPV